MRNFSLLIVAAVLAFGTYLGLLKLFQAAYIAAGAQTPLGSALASAFIWMSPMFLGWLTCLVLWVCAFLLVRRLAR